MNKPTPENAKIHALHGLRGVMAWWVVLGHVSLTFGWQIPLIDRNALAVEVFVLLSGFVIAMLIDRKVEPYGKYIVRRAFRVFPLYLVILFISAALLPVQIGAWNSLQGSPLNLNRLTLALDGWEYLGGHMLAHVPLLQGLIPTAISSQAPYTIVGQAWSVSLEWQFYLVAPYLVWALAKLPRTPLALSAIALLLGLSHWFAGAFLGAKIIHFAIGMVTYKIIRRGEIQFWMSGLSLLVAAAVVKNGAMQFIPLGVWLSVVWSASRPSHSCGHLIARWLGSAPLFRMGEISYSVYLVHMIPLYTLIYLLRASSLPTEIMQAIVLLGTVGITLALAVITFRYVEKPGIALGARLTSYKR